MVNENHSKKREITMAFITEKEQVKIKIEKFNDFYADARNKGIFSIVPFDIYAYVNTFDDIEIINDDLSSEISGMIEYISGGFIITINKYHSYERRRFTLAHEFGHYCMHREYLINNKSIKDVALFRSENTKDQKEFEANEFATNILLPKDEFISVIKSGKTKLRDIAEYFCVSASAVKYRAYELDLIKDY